MIEPSQYLARAKRKDNDAWETGSLVVIRGETSEEQVFLADKMTGTLIPVQAKTIGRYVGRNDKTGRMMFGGDIVKATWICDQDNISGQIIWWHGCFAIRDKKTGDIPAIDLFNNHEVIGNIYDNPELLGGVSNGN